LTLPLTEVTGSDGTTIADHGAGRGVLLGTLQRETQLAGRLDWPPPGDLVAELAGSQ